jgi:hypothetical protein
MSTWEMGLFRGGYVGSAFTSTVEVRIAGYAVPGWPVGRWSGVDLGA